MHQGWLSHPCTVLHPASARSTDVGGARMNSRNMSIKLLYGSDAEASYKVCVDTAPSAHLPRPSHIPPILLFRGRRRAAASAKACRAASAGAAGGGGRSCSGSGGTTAKWCCSRRLHSRTADVAQSFSSFGSASTTVAICSPPPPPEANACLSISSILRTSVATRSAMLSPPLPSRPR